MLTPQEVSTHAFTKAVMGGYNMAMVDEFLDELTDDYTALYKENAGLKAKMKVLVEKVEDYRATEDSMRATLLTAQKMADSIVHEAEMKRSQILAEAESEARGKIGQLQVELSEAEQRLRRGQLELARFVGASRDLCTQQTQFLEKLPYLAVDVPAPAAPNQQVLAAAEIEERVFASFDQAEEPAPEEEEELPPEEEPLVVASDDYPEEDPFVSPDEPTHRVHLKDLKFGRNYSADK